jgi:uncharacterized protein (DUF4213/DUF364 family)
MKLLEDLLHSLTGDYPVTAGAIGSHLIAVSSRRLGLASNLTGHDSNHSVVFTEGIPPLPGSSSRDLANWLLEEQLLKAGVGMAALNSLLEPKPDSLIELNAKKLIAAKATGKNLAVVGHFPFIEELRSKVQRLWVIEKQPRKGDISEDQGFLVLPEADVVAVTASSLINHTFQRILASCKPGSFKIMLGPSTPLSRILFDYGVDVIGGTLVEREHRVLEMVKQGTPFRRLQGVRTVVMARNSISA